MRVADRLPAATGLPCTSTNCVYLTFDDGPDPHWTPRILEALERQHARATFFVIGRLAQQCGPLLRQAHAAGHAIGNHGWSHRHPWTLGRARAAQEVRDGADAVAQVLGVRTAWFRPPHGRLGPWLAAAARAERQRIVLWNVSAIDWGPLGSPRQVARRASTVRPGDVVLMHDGAWLRNRPASTLCALPVVLGRLQRARFAPMPLPDATLAQ